MANYDFTNIGYNSNNYYARDTRAYLVKGTQTASTNAWTGTLPDGVADYYDGLTVDYFLPFAGTSTAATLNLSGKGAKPIYVGGIDPVKTHFPQYSTIRLTYLINSALNSGNGCWQAVGSVLGNDTNDKVAQTATTTNSNYEILFSGTADNTTRVEGARKTSTLLYNPSTKALSTGGSVNGITLSPQTTGFKLSGGTTSKTLTIGADYTLAAACTKGVTDNTSATAVTSTDQNLITGRTLYYAGYTKNTGTVTEITAGAGLNTTSADTATDGGNITGNGTLYLTKTGVTAGSYGDSSNQTPGYGGTFSVPYITVDKYGRVTNVSAHTVKIPASDNTWRPVQNNLTSDSTTDSLSAKQGKVLNTNINTLNTNIGTKSRVIKYISSSFSSLPQTFTIDNCTTTMECIKAVLSVPSAQGSDWIVNTDTAGKATISGTFSGSTATTITLYLADIK